MTLLRALRGGRGGLAAAAVDSGLLGPPWRRGAAARSLGRAFGSGEDRIDGLDGDAPGVGAPRRVDQSGGAGPGDGRPPRLAAGEPSAPGPADAPPTTPGASEPDPPLHARHPATTERIISIDRSGLLPGMGAPLPQATKEPETALARHLKGVIGFRSGPITLAEYVREVLTNAHAGYYVSREVFGSRGDFTTSPEISQVFGELIGVWCVATWQGLGSPERLRIVELGPGRGTLMSDLLRSTAVFEGFSRAVREVHLVEVSPKLRKLQYEALRCERPEGGAAGAGGPGLPQPSPAGSSPETLPTAESAVSSAVSGWNGAHVTWHSSIDEVPGAAPAPGRGGAAAPSSGEGEGEEAPPPTIYIAHEFLDALPVHQFEKTSGGWRERLVDVASEDSPLHLRLVLAPRPTPASALALPRRLRGLPKAKRDSIDALELCPQGMALAETLSRRIGAHGGAALLVDYGRDEPYGASLQAIRDHEFTGILEAPGLADLSAWVDFSALAQAVEETDAGCELLGSVSQAELLLSLGLEHRVRALLEMATEQQAEDLIAAAHRLVGTAAAEGEGERADAGGSGGASRERRPSGSAAVPPAASPAPPPGMGETYRAVAIVKKGDPSPVFRR